MNTGEEPYTLAIIWELELAQRFPTLALRILATDVQAAMLARARRAYFSASSLKELPKPRLHLLRADAPGSSPGTPAKTSFSACPCGSRPD